jgi:hypothetical protein
MLESVRPLGGAGCARTGDSGDADNCGFPEAWPEF